MKRPLFVLVIMLAASIARADSMTYNLTTYTYPDILNSALTDTLSGTVTLTNNVGSVFGTYVAGDPSLTDVTMSATLTMTSSDPSIVPVTLAGSASIGADVPPFVNWLQEGSLTATPLGLFLSNDGYLTIDYSGTLPFSAYLVANIDPHDAGGTISAYANPGGNINNGAATMQMFPQNLDVVYGTGAWQIAAAVPEPSSLILCGLGGLALLAYRKQVAGRASL